MFVSEWQEEGDVEEYRGLEDEEATRYRAIAARINYLSADRPDLQYAAKEVCRDMSTPTDGSWRRLVRIARYLIGHPCLIWKHELQDEVETAEAFSDANWAGCRQSRKSTSGAVMKIGRHPIKAYSKTQATIAKPSAESELSGIVRAMCEA